MGLTLEWRSFSRRAATFVADSMIIYLILILGLLNWMSFMSSRVLMPLYALELGGSYLHYRGARTE